ncbi:Autophagy-related protein 27 [Madurella mycetomatis]|uniref:Autophagy-related protein 27 n=1 Tax=Madurella mycetomatis TaxID=100816 RepID=A0A175VRN9_9PEZI|nr:Autophagy-related protein 27 [Madurella mycetomatis]
MKPTLEAAATAFASLLLLAPAPVAAVFKCDELVADGHKYNFQALAGPHTVVTHEYTRPTYHNTTYTIDLCAPLQRKGDVPKEERCPDGTRVCAIKHRWDPKSDKTPTDQVIPIVVGSSDKPFAWDLKRLPAEDPEKKDAKKEGLRVTLSGSSYQQRAQRAVVDFRCDPELAGTEGEWESIDEYEKEGKEEKKRRDEEGDGGDDGEDDASTPEEQLKKKGAALIWRGYRRDKDEEGKDMDSLYLTWYTKHACDAAVDEPAAESGHWGFFTWLVILVFLAVAAYLIFGSWLNYNRYGARGWDLLPHGDTIRDIPYLLKDWTRRVLNTVQSSGSRGGYSAV